MADFQFPRLVHPSFLPSLSTFPLMKRLFLSSLFLLVSLAGLHATPAASLPTMPPDLIQRAVRLKAPRWKFVEKAVMREIPETFALQVTAVAAFQEPGRIVDGKAIATHLAEKLRYILVTPRPTPQADGSTNEPESLGGIGGWTHQVPAHVLLLAKRTPAVWSQLSADEKARADLRSGEHTSELQS